MKQVSQLRSPELLTSVILALVVLAAAINQQPLLGIIVVILAEGWRWWRSGELTLNRLQTNSWLWLAGISSVIILSLNPMRVTQVMLALAYSAWRWWLLQRTGAEDHIMVAAAISQALWLWAIFLAAAVWHWPSIIVLALVWSGSYIVGRRALVPMGDDPAGEVLALTWALLVAECSWVFSLWLVNYIVFAGLLIVPQPALVLTALGYCLAGIYVSHRRSQLSRARLIEYLMIGLVILVIVIAGTKWNGVI